MNFTNLARTRTRMNFSILAFTPLPPQSSASVLTLIPQQQTPPPPPNPQHPFHFLLHALPVYPLPQFTKNSSPPRFVPSHTHTHRSHGEGVNLEGAVWFFGKEVLVNWGKGVLAWGMY